MATFEISGPDGGTYHVDAPDAQTAFQAFSKFSGASAAPAPPDKYQQAALDEKASLASKGINEDAGLTRRLAHGATMGWDSTLLAGALTPLEMIKRGTPNPAEGYNYAKAREDLIMNDARQNTGALGTATEILGGGVTGAGLASSGATFARGLPAAAGLFPRALASAGDSAAMGALYGASEGNGIYERLANAGKGAAIGGAVGGALPLGLSALGAAAAPVISNIRARFNPTGFAQSQVARAVNESGLTPSQIEGAVTQAGNEGQGVFNVADAMGNSGQRMLSTVARAPGDGRTAVVNALENRQAGQGRRIANTLAEGFDSPQTAQQTAQRLTNARDAAADTNYGAVRNDANPVDLSGTIARIDQTLSPGVNQIVRPQSGIANDSVESALQGIRDRLTDGRSVLSDFTAVQRVRGDLSDAITSAQRAGAGNKARLLGGVLRELDSAMEGASAGHQAANRAFAQASRNIEAVQTGRDAAMRGRSEDVVPAFRALPAEGQTAFRSGYVDPLIEQAQGAAVGVNKARPLQSDAFRTEAAAIAPLRTQNLMTRRIGREQTMFETRNQALGGSRIADNLADAEAAGIDPHLITQVATGNWHGALRTALAAGSNALTGNTPAVRQAIANILLQNGSNLAPGALQQMIGSTLQRIQYVQSLARNMGRGAAGGLAVAGPGQSRR